MKDDFKNFIFSADKIVGKSKPIIANEKNNKINIYWGVKVSNQININIIFFINKLMELQKFNCNIIILIADIHTLIDSSFSFKDSEINSFIAKLEKALSLIKLKDNNEIKLIKGSQFQLDKTYILDVFKLISFYNISELCQEFDLDIKDSSFKEILHPLLQCLDEEYINKTKNIDIDCQIGYNHQHKYYVFNKKTSEKMNFKKRLYVLFDIPIQLINDPMPLYYNQNFFIYYLKKYDKQTLKFIQNIFINFTSYIENDLNEAFKNLDKINDYDKKIFEFAILISKIMINYF